MSSGALQARHQKEVKVTRREKVAFPSDTVSCAGYLFHPEPQAGTGKRLPVVILAHGFSGTMDRLGSPCRTVRRRRHRRPGL